MRSFHIRRPPAQPPQLTKAAAETLAIAALSYLAGNPGRLDHFLALTGLGRESLRAAAREPGFLAAILDHLAADETLLLKFAAHAGLEPSLIARARDILSPPAEMP
ncbi:MAG: DUF3572 domain-containing protein [Methylocella sp.]